MVSWRLDRHADSACSADAVLEVRSTPATGEPGKVNPVSPNSLLEIQICIVGALSVRREFKRRLASSGK